MRLRLRLAWLLVALLPGCSRPRLDPFPSAQESGGWIKGRVRTFEAAELWRYIDGDAERYLQAGIERTFSAEYRYQERLEAVADVHCMRTAAAARRIFEWEPSTSSRPAPVGEAARSYGTSLTFRRGRYFVRLVAYADSPEAGPALLELAKGIDARLARARP